MTTKSIAKSNLLSTEKKKGKKELKEEDNYNRDSARSMMRAVTKSTSIQDDGSA